MLHGYTIAIATTTDPINCEDAGYGRFFMKKDPSIEFVYYNSSVLNVNHITDALALIMLPMFRSECWFLNFKRYLLVNFLLR